MDASEEKELKEVFDDWFSSILLAQPTCLYRDVLRDSQSTMWESWKHRKPVWTSAEIAQAKINAERLYRVLNEE